MWLDSQTGINDDSNVSLMQKQGLFFLIKIVNKGFVCPAANDEKDFQDFYPKVTTLMEVSFLCLTNIFYHC